MKRLYLALVWTAFVTFPTLSHSQNIANNNGFGTNTTLVSFENLNGTNLTAQTIYATNVMIQPGGNISSIGENDLVLQSGGTPVLDLGANASINGHFVLGSTNNSVPEDYGNNDLGVGIISGNNNSVSDYMGLHMISEYI